MIHGLQRLWVRGLGFAAGCVLMAGPLAQAATNYYYVGRDGSHDSPFGDWGKAATNIQAAIDRAESDLALAPGTVCIVVVTNDTYKLTEQIEINAAITVRSFTGWEETIIDGGGVTRCVSINHADAVFDDLTVSNGYITGTTVYGAGIDLIAGTVRNCRITKGWATGFGGGVAVRGTSAALRNSIIDGNRGGQGGGIVMTAAGLIADCVITNNVSDSYFQRGGAIRMSSGTVERCLIAGNRGGEGAGIRLYNGTVRNCLILDNRADISPYIGGGVYQDNGTLQNCTVSGNSATLTGGGVYLNGNNARVRNTIIYFNTATSSDNLHRLSGWFENSCTHPAVPDDDKASNNQSADPQFGDHAGDDFDLLPGSPCIDSGSATSAPADDYEGGARPLDGDGAGGTAYDMGAFEAPAFDDEPYRCNFIGEPVYGFAPLAVVFQAHVAGPDTNSIQYAWNFGDGQSEGWSVRSRVTNVYEAGTFDIELTVSNAAGRVTNIVKTAYVFAGAETIHVSRSGSHDEPFASWDTAATNFQDAVDAALDTVDMKSRVLVGEGRYVLDETLVIEKNIVIESSEGRDVTILDGGGDSNANRAVYIGASGSVFRGFTVSNALTTLNGAGIYLQGGAVHDCVVTKNRTSGSGGGIYMASGTTVSNCLVAGNHLTSGGSGGGVYLTGSSVLLDSEIRANLIDGNGYGAGVSANGASALIRRCQIVGNTNFYRGGGVHLSYALLDDSMVEANVAREGGGLFADYGVVDRSVFIYNRISSGTSGGGAAYLRTSSLFRNSLVAGNDSGSGVGGGIRVQHGSGQRVLNCTVTGNRSGSQGGGIYQETGAITNTIMYFNEGAGSPNDLRGTALVAAFSCSPDLTDGVDGNLSADPMFADGGSGVGLGHALGGDHRLRRGSPCIDAGANQTWMTGALDLYGMPRLQPAGGVVNMGAVEGIWRPPGTRLMLR